MADPVAPNKHRAELVREFVEWSCDRRLRACFLPVCETSLQYYPGLAQLQVGSSAIVTTDKFLNTTANDKWWRWKKNRAIKQGYEYGRSKAPHSPEFIESLRSVSDDWLTVDGRQERCFALGYFDEGYIQACDIHYLKDEAGYIVAFTNQVPNLKKSTTSTVDLLRHKPEAKDAMPYLLYNVIESVHADGYKLFDLGFVPFASTKGQIQNIARTLNGRNFSAKGLEQFKNKFDPTWEAYYFAYDGDLGDLALIAINLEKAMKVS